MVKSIAFSDEEDRSIIEAYNAHRTVIESKLKEGVSPAAKKRAWSHIAEKVNAVSLF